MNVKELLALEDDEELARELGYYVLGKMDREKFESLSPVEQVIACLTGLEMEVNNGGFDQFYWNSPGDYALQTVAALEALGARHTAGLLTSANAVFGRNGPDPDRERRDRQMRALAQVAKDKWFELDGAFYEYRDNLTALAAAYMRKNAQGFTD